MQKERKVLKLLVIIIKIQRKGWDFAIKYWFIYMKWLKCDNSYESKALWKLKKVDEIKGIEVRKL